MGKREWLLIVGFLTLGTVVYQLTAPASAERSGGLSFAQILRNIRAGFHGEPDKRVVRREAVAAVPPEVTALRVAGYRGTLIVTGGERADAQATLSTEAYGVDPADAEAKAGLVRLAWTVNGDAIEIAIEQPTSRRRAPLELRVEIPRRLAARLETRGRVEVAGVASLSFDTRLGSVSVRNIDGETAGDHRDGDLTVAGVASLRVNARRATVRVEDLRGTLGGEVTDGRAVVRNVRGTVTLEARRTEVDLERVGEVSLVATDGSATVRHAGGPVRFDGERCRLTVSGSEASALDATSSDAAVELQLPSERGITLDVIAESGRLELGDLPIEVTRSDRRETVQHAVAGGGTLWKVRTTRGDIIIRR